MPSFTLDCISGELEDSLILECKTELNSIVPTQSDHTFSEMSLAFFLRRVEFQASAT